jgi:hypothetical protein
MTTLNFIGSAEGDSLRNNNIREIAAALEEGQKVEFGNEEGVTSVLSKEGNKYLCKAQGESYLDLEAVLRCDHVDADDPAFSRSRIDMVANLLKEHLGLGYEYVTYYKTI